MSMKCIACGEMLSSEVAEDLNNAGLCDSCVNTCDRCARSGAVAGGTWGGYADDYWYVCGECLTELQHQGKALT